MARPAGQTAAVQLVDSMNMTEHIDPYVTHMDQKLQAEVTEKTMARTVQLCNRQSHKLPFKEHWTTQNIAVLKLITQAGTKKLEHRRRRKEKDCINRKRNQDQRQKMQRTLWDQFSCPSHVQRQSKSAVKYTTTTNHIERRNSRFLQSSHSIPNCLKHIHSNGHSAIVCKSHATYRVLSHATYRVPHGMKRQLLSLTEFK